MKTPHDPTGSFSTLDAVIAQYLQAVEAGQAPDRSSLLALHPELAGSLLDFFADLDRIDRVASPLRMADADETAGLPSWRELGSTEIVRYFGDYELLDEIARGGMGVVYKARQVSLNRIVALKMVLAGAFASSRDVQRFRIEAEAAANLGHAHIVPIYEVGEHEGQPYFSMKFVEGTSLAAHPRGPARREVAGLVEVARAVHHAHQHGVLHRDLKPSNILVDADGRHLVADFGLAKRLSDVDASLTETGQLLGTPRYMAPEQALGRKDLTVTADVYSLGVILFERLTGRTPFLADNVVSLLHQVREADPPRLSTITPGLGRDLETIVAKCLDKIPARRYPTAEALALDLENWLAGRPIAARPVGPPARAWRWCRRNPAVAALLTAVAASLLAGAAVSIAFALRAEARALEAGISATRARLLVARNVTGNNPKDIGIALLSYARAFRHVPADRSADDLRWFISANLTVVGRRFHNLLLPLEGGEIAIKLEALSPDGRTYVGLSPDGQLRLWNLLSGRLRAIFHDNRSGVRRLKFSPDGRLIASIQERASRDYRYVKVYGGKEMPVLEDERVAGPIQLRIWDVENRQEGPSIDLDENLDAIEFSPDHHYVALNYAREESGIRRSDRPYRCRLYEVVQGRKIADFVCRVPFSPPRFAPDSRTLILEGDQETLIVDTQSGRLRYRLDALKVISSRSGWELAGIHGKQVWFMEAESGRPVRSPIEFEAMPHETNRGDPILTSFDYSPDDRFLIIENDLFDLTTGRKIEHSQPSTGWICPAGRSRAFSLDGRLAIDLKRLRAISRSTENRFHPDLVEYMSPRRLFFPNDSPNGNKDSELWDLPTGLAFTQAGILPGRSEIYWSDGDSILFSESDSSKYGVFGVGPQADLDPVFYLPREAIANDPEVMELWAEVLSRHRLVEGTNSEKLDEAEWERRRRRLIEILPKSPSPVLTLVANDRLHWLRREVIEENTDDSINTRSADNGRNHPREPYEATNTPASRDRDRKIATLTRLIDAEPRWWVREYRGMALAKQGRADEAGSDIAAVARAAGDWYWTVVPPILDVATMDRLLLLEDPASTLRDDRKLGPDAVEVVMRYLGRISRDPERTGWATICALHVRGLPPEVYRKSLTYLLPIKDDETEGSQLLAVGLAHYRIGRFQDALAILNRVEPAFTIGYEQAADQGIWNCLRERCQVYSVLALVHEGLGHHREAVEWLGKACRVEVDVARDSNGLPAGSLLIEAEEVILDRGFPADPFARQD